MIQTPPKFFYNFSSRTLKVLPGAPNLNLLMSVDSQRQGMNIQLMKNIIAQIKIWSTF